MGCSSCAKAAASRIGNAATNPIILGDPLVPAQSTRVKVLSGADLGVPDGAVKYVTGDALDDFIGEGLVAPLSGNPRGSGIVEGRRWWQVGRLGYLNLGPAQVRSEQTGEEIAERFVGG